MGDLQRRRAALDLRISRSHLRAAAVGVAIISGISFGLGVLVGRDKLPPPEERSLGLLAPVADDAVVELLARVEAAAPGDDRSDLTFPDALRGEASSGSAADEGPQALEEPLHVAASEPVQPGEVDPVPERRFTVEVLRTPDGGEARATRDHLRDRGLGAWLDAALVEGELQYRVAVNGFDVEERAVEAVAEVELALEDGPPGSEPVVAPID